MTKGPVLTAALYAGVLGVTAAAATTVDPLAALVWKARPVVVLADSAQDPGYKRQLAVLDADARTLADYDVTVVRIAGPDRALRRILGVPETGFSVVLVGKDGGVKERWRQPVDPAAIFALIDTMPMRKDEARTRVPNR